MTGPTPGAQLQRARLERGLTLHQIAARTKIRVPILQRLERDDYAAVGGDVFVRGFLVAFAREVGLDGAALVAHYVASHEPPPPPEAAPDVSAALAAVNRSRALIGVGNIVVIVAVVAASLVWMNVRDADVGQDVDGAIIATGGRSAPADEVAAVSTPLTMEHDNVVEAVNRTDRLVVDVTATDPLWLEATVDGARTVRRLLRAGEEVQLDARADVTMLVGDAAAIRYAINRAPARPVGGSGEVRRVHITRDNFESFLAAQ